jgi:transposase-like protein
MVGLGTHRTKEEKARIVLEVLSSSSTISEICRKYNVASPAVYKWRDEFISAGTASIDHGRSTVEASLTREINELNGIIGELTIATEAFKKFNLQGEAESHD